MTTIIVASGCVAAIVGFLSLTTQVEVEHWRMPVYAVWVKPPGGLWHDVRLAFLDSGPVVAIDGRAWPTSN